MTRALETLGSPTADCICVGVMRKAAIAIATVAIWTFNIAIWWIV